MANQQYLGKIQIAGVEVDTGKEYYSVTITDGLSNRKVRANGDWAKALAIGQTYDVMWHESEYRGKPTYKITSGQEGQKQTQPQGGTQKNTQATPQQAMPLDERKTNAFMVAATAFSGKYEDLEALVKMARQVYKAMYDSSAKPKTSQAAPAAAAVPAPTPAPTPVPEPTPAPATLPIDFDTVDGEFEEDPAMPF